MYLENLYNQFKEAKGISTSSKKLNSLDADFGIWLRINSEIGKEYMKFLDSFKIMYDTEKCVEIGKGYYDTAVLPYNTEIITPALFTFKNKDSRRIRGGTLTLISGIPAIIKGSKKLSIEKVSDSNYSIYMTQNPFNKLEIDALKSIYEQEYGDVIIGMYGLNTDKNKKEKIDKIFELEKTNQYDVIYNDLNEYYVTAAISKPKQVLKKTIDIPTIKNGIWIKR